MIQPVITAGGTGSRLWPVSRQLNAKQLPYIQVGGLHCLESPGVIPLELIEVQSGSYLGEDDIVRLKVQYGRT